MKPTTASALFSLVVVGVNWHWTSLYRPLHLGIRLSVDGAGLVLLFCLIALLLISRGLYRHVRLCLDQGIRIPCRTRFMEFWPCLLLFPLFFRWNTTSTGTTHGGIDFTYSFGYGSDVSAYALILSVLTILLYQCHQMLAERIRNSQKAQTES